MKSLGDQALKKIQNLIVSKQPKPSTSPKKQKSLATFRPSKIVQEDNRKSPSSKFLNKSPSKKSTTVYIPREREIKLLQKQTLNIYKELNQRANFKMQNTHSFFLNEKNPKPPIYERAQDIVKQREQALQEKRRQKLREKQEAEEREYEEFLKVQLAKKTFSKEQAYIASDRLYRQHYSKANRLNQKKIERYKEESKNYRDKPLINNASKQIYNVVAEKNKLQTDIIDRFGQYEVEKTEKHKETQQKYKNQYYPFKPLISDNSKMINTAREEKSMELGKSSHCLSCNIINATASPSRSPAKSYIFEQS